MVIVLNSLNITGNQNIEIRSAFLWIVLNSLNITGNQNATHCVLNNIGSS